MSKLVLLSIVFFLIAGGIAFTLFSFEKPPVTVIPNPSQETSLTSENIIESEHALVPGFPEFPVYPGAEIEESKARAVALNTGNDLVAEWTTQDPVPQVMQWYVEELRKAGWTVEPPDDTVAAEQIAQISKGELTGYIGVEREESNKTEIVVNFKKSSL